MAFLLLYGRLPNKSELDAYRKRLASLRGLPGALKAVLEQLPVDDFVYEPPLRQGPLPSTGIRPPLAE